MSDNKKDKNLSTFEEFVSRNVDFNVDDDNIELSKDVKYDSLVNNIGENSDLPKAIKIKKYNISVEVINNNPSKRIEIDSRY
jgi:hypothetical protein